jgi:hypothetical protein
MQSAGLRAAALGLVGVALLLGAAGCGSGSGSSSASTTSSSSSATTVPLGDGSIQGYGAAADGSDRAAVSDAVHGFLSAIATGDYDEVCADLIGATRKGLEAFGEGKDGSECSTILTQFLSPAAAGEAKKAAAGPISSVRIKADTAFAIFTPQGGQPSYLAMKREGGSWKAISVAPGTPLEPTAAG